MLSPRKLFQMQSPASSPESKSSVASSTHSPSRNPLEIVEWVPRSIRNDSAVIEQAVLHQISAGRPTSTKKAHDSKINEYYEYCQSVYSSDPFCNNLDHEKVFFFMFYQAMREPRKRGGGRNRPRAKFNREEYESIIAQHRDWMKNPNNSPPPVPDTAVSEVTFAQYKQCLRWIYKDQVARRVTTLTWDQVWPLACNNLHHLVKTRRAEHKKKNYHEKVDHEFAPYTVVEDFPLIEQETWKNGYGSVRSASAWLRHRYCLLQSTSGILRCESLFKAELSDLLGVVVCHDHDPHPIYVLVMQIATGK